MLNLHWELAPFHKVQAMPGLEVFQPQNWFLPLISPVHAMLQEALRLWACHFNTATQSFTIQDLVASLLITSTKLQALDSHAIGRKEAFFCKPLCKRLLWKNNPRFRKKILLSLPFTAVSSENSSFFQ
jgi:hypothetical protein